MKRLLVIVDRLRRGDGGQDLIEYGLLMALIAIAAMFAISTLGNTIQSVFWNPIAQTF